MVVAIRYLSWRDCCREEGFMDFAYGDHFIFNRLFDADFLVGLILILYFSTPLGLPASGRLPSEYWIEAESGFMLYDTWVSDEPGAFIAAIKSLILPSIVLGTIPLAVVTRMTRSSMLEVLGEDYIRTAKAKGLNTTRIVIVHALRNALIPVVTVVGLIVGQLLSGAVLTENISRGRVSVNGLSMRLTHVTIRYYKVRY
ncbi:dipeptide transport system permease [Actinobacillus equuli]|nr:dipeptide transport system permease [Actinobacillus equuli]